MPRLILAKDLIFTAQPIFDFLPGNRPVAIVTQERKPEGFLPAGWLNRRLDDLESAAGNQFGQVDRLGQPPVIEINRGP